MGFKNITLFLLQIGGSPVDFDKQERNCYHTLAYRGEYESALMVLNYQRHSKLRNLYQTLYKEKHKYAIKSLDIDHGKLVSTTLHDNEQIKNHFQFNLSAESLFEAYCQDVKQKHCKYLKNDDRLLMNTLKLCFRKTLWERILYIMEHRLNSQSNLNPIIKELQFPNLCK